ncbi:MAG TPA: hypothetical protein VMW76_08430 [Bacteroidales bacterium]|nr:hypothetical protein [Bacteroidales bacterium]
MASVRELKKDIDYLVFEVISDCFTVMSVKPEEKSEELSLIVADAVKLRNDLVARANHPVGKDNPGLVKAHYRKLREDLVKGVDKLFDRISKVVKK